MKEKISILIIEDHIMMRLATATVIENVKKFELRGQAKDGLEGVEFAKKYLPNVILMDIGLPKLDGIEATEKIRELGINSKILMFTSSNKKEDVFAALKAGADGYIMKDATPETLVIAIETVSQGAAWLDPQIAKVVLQSVNEVDKQNSEEKHDKAKNQYGLTKREIEILNLIVDGLNNEEMAEKLVLSLSTVKAHVHSILQKLYSRDKVQAAVIAIKEGLI